MTIKEQADAIWRQMHLDVAAIKAKATADVAALYAKGRHDKEQAKRTAKSQKEQQARHEREQAILASWREDPTARYIVKWEGTAYYFGDTLPNGTIAGADHPDYAFIMKITARP